jgi:hypothetical protein
MYLLLTTLSFANSDLVSLNLETKESIPSPLSVELMLQKLQIRPEDTAYVSVETTEKKKSIRWFLLDGHLLTKERQLKNGDCRQFQGRDPVQNIRELHSFKSTETHDGLFLSTTDENTQVMVDLMPGESLSVTTMLSNIDTSAEELINLQRNSGSLRIHRDGQRVKTCMAQALETL